LQYYNNFSAFTIATHTGDSIIKPTYGLISLNGVIPFLSSQDIVGNISKFVIDLCILTTYLQKHD